MPHGQVTPLSTACNQELSLLVYTALTEIEGRVQKPDNEGRNVQEWEVEEMGRANEALSIDFFKNLPGTTLSHLIKHVLDLYIDSVIFFNQLFNLPSLKDKTAKVTIQSILMGESQLNTAFPWLGLAEEDFIGAVDKVRLTTGKMMTRFKGTLLEKVWDRTDRLPSLPTLLRALLNFRHGLVVLDFSPLRLLACNTKTKDSPVSRISQIFLDHLRSRVASIGPYLVELNLCGVRADLPCCDDRLLGEISKHCPNLRHLNISHNKNTLTSEGLMTLAPVEEGKGCPSLDTLDIYDNAFNDRDVARLVKCLPDLSTLGYKETGKVVKHLFKSGLSLPKLTHLNNMGTRSRKLIPAGLRFKRNLTEMAINVCPNVHNIKLRVKDTDCNALAELKCLRSIELLFQVGSLGGPAGGTTHFLQMRGSQLTSVAITCDSFGMVWFKTVGELCPNLQQLWIRTKRLIIPSALPSGAEFNLNGEVNVRAHTDFPLSHGYFKALRIFYLRSGSNELDLQTVHGYFLPYMLRNASHIEELILAVRTLIFCDTYVEHLFKTLPNLANLSKLIIAISGLNSLPVLPLTLVSAYRAVQLCPKLEVLGNLLTWTVAPSPGDPDADVINAARVQFIEDCRNRTLPVKVQFEKQRIH